MCNGLMLKYFPPSSEFGKENGRNSQFPRENLGLGSEEGALAFETKQQRGVVCEMFGGGGGGGLEREREM